MSARVACEGCFDVIGTGTCKQCGRDWFTWKRPTRVFRTDFTKRPPPAESVKQPSPIVSGERCLCREDAGVVLSLNGPYCRRCRSLKVAAKPVEQPSPYSEPVNPKTHWDWDPRALCWVEKPGPKTEWPGFEAWAPGCTAKPDPYAAHALRDQLGALRTENDELLRDNARLRREVERLERKVRR